MFMMRRILYKVVEETVFGIKFLELILRELEREVELGKKKVQENWVKRAGSLITLKISVLKILKEY